MPSPATWLVGSGHSQRSPAPAPIRSRLARAECSSALAASCAPLGSPVDPEVAITTATSPGTFPRLPPWPAPAASGGPTPSPSIASPPAPAGRSEVVRAVFGIDRFDAGRVTVAGKPLPPASPTGAMAAGLALVPEDRRLQGLVMDMSIERNVGLTQLRTLHRGGLMSRRRERSRAADWALRLQVKYARLADAVTTLSGGNQQKVVLAKWLATDPVVLIVDEPTRGIDVGTKAEVHRLLSELAAQGVKLTVIGRRDRLPHSLVTAIAGATAGANLTVIGLDIAWDLQARERYPVEEVRPSVAMT